MTLFAFAPLVHADVAYYLTTDGCTGTCGTGPYGTIDLSQTNANMVTVGFSLAPGVTFANTGAGAALAFEVSGPAPVITILPTSSPSASDYTAGSAVKASAFGNFDLSIFCTGCKNGGSTSNPAGPIDFTVSRSTGLSVNDFVSSLDNKGNPTGFYFFASDIMGTNGKTGNVAALAGTSVTPEPTYELLLIGMIGAVVWFGRHRVRRAA
jgi:hypothetical protein